MRPRTNRCGGFLRPPASHEHGRPDCIRDPAQLRRMSKLEEPTIPNLFPRFSPITDQRRTTNNQARGKRSAARAEVGYNGTFLYAYATKANFAEEVVRTALAAGAHYETSATADVLIAHHLWRQGVLEESRYMFCNGSKEDGYIDAIVAMRTAGYERIVPILDSLDELDALLTRC